MGSNERSRKKKTSDKSDEHQAKRPRQTGNEEENLEECIAGKVKKIRIHNFMCHDALEVTLNENVNFIVGRNGSGKSAILTALTVGLGARANVTSRGTSIKEFIKKGRTAALIEITLTNTGDTAYKPDVYGNIIVVVRTIRMNTSSYKIKNWKGDVISTRRSELDSIIAAMNIQIDNPICILNQDVSRSFLITSKPDERYSLFMKATLLDTIENNYKEALEMCEEEYEKLNQYSETLTQVKKEIQKLKNNVNTVEKLDVTRRELNDLENELCWATAITEETKLHKIQEKLNMCKSSLQDLQNAELSAGTKDEEIDAKIKELKEKIQQAEKEAVDSGEAYNSAKQQHTVARETHSNKQREWRSAVSRIKRLEEDINLLKKEIQKVEGCNDEEHNKRKKMMECLSNLEEKLDEVEASLRTKQTELMHLEADKVRLLQEIQSAKNEVDTSQYRIDKIKRELNAFEQQKDDALSVFGPHIPRLLRRIEEEYKKGRFKEKPRGPIGAYMKMKDAAWAPAVESFLGYGTLSTFCVDNSQDARFLTSIMKEIYYNENIPAIISSKFFFEVHDVRHHCTQSSRYSNLLDAMVIEDPIVANCLIDQREIECVLLIPTNQEACEVMSDEAKVPKNCRRAFTQRGDLFFPSPNYRTYGKQCGKRAKFLQVSTMEAMQTLREELQTAEIKRKEAVEAYKAVCEKATRTTTEWNNVNAAVKKLQSKQRSHTDEIRTLKDEIESNEATSADVFRNEVVELEKKLAQERTNEKSLAKDMKEQQKNVESLDAEVRRCRDLRHNIHTVIDPLKDQIKEFMREKERHRQGSARAAKKLQELKQDVQRASGEFEAQERATKKAVSDATAKCPRINTTRSVNQIKQLANDLREKIHEVEHQYGCVDDLRQQLREKEEKYGANIEFASQLRQSCEKHIERVKHRQNMFIQLRELYGVYIQKSFTDVLSLRQYKGTVEVDHDNKVLNLHVSASGTENGEKQKDTRTLSGGERSYSTVAFILALWDCIKLPFYFLDEFDVFMDKVNRRVIMDILLDHTKSNPQSQFTFLTPLDTSHILAEEYVTIHQLQPPERRGLTQ